MAQEDRSLLEAALVGYQAESEKISAAIAEIQRRLRGAGRASDPPAEQILEPPAASARTSSLRRKKRTISAEGRQRIAEAQRKRWAAQKKGK